MSFVGKPVNKLLTAIGVLPKPPKAPSILAPPEVPEPEAPPPPPELPKESPERRAQLAQTSQKKAASTTRSRGRGRTILTSNPDKLGLGTSTPTLINKTLLGR